MVFLLEFLKLISSQNINFVSHVFDDSSLILLFPLHTFSVNNFSVKLFSDNTLRSVGSNFQI
jgi:hypothetical protein